MKKLLLLLALVSIARSAPPDCIATYRFTNRSTDSADGISVIALSSGHGAAPAINNKSQGCVGWELMTSVEGLTAVSVQLEDSANTYTVAGGSPTQWLAYQGTVVSGSNPTTSVTTSTFVATNYYPWIRVNVGSSTGTGSIDVLLFGWRSTTLLTGGGGGGGGAVSTVFGRAGDVVAADGDYTFDLINGVVDLTQLPTTSAVWIVNATLPATCTPNKDLWRDPTLFDIWFCSATNTWRKLLSTSNSGQLQLTGPVGSTPSTPAANNATLYFNSSTKALKSVNDAGVETDYTNPSQLSGTAAATIKAHSFGCSFDGGGTAIANGSTCYIPDIPFACTIDGYSIAADTGTATVKFWKVATGTALPTVSNVINTSGLSLSSGTLVRSSTVTDFTSTAVTAHDAAAVTITTISGPTKLLVTAECNL